jgi:asparagine synthase (glutamine-hydrolysing)
MCGIACIISKDIKEHGYIYEMTDLVEHRGKDGCGHYIEYGDGISLGHRRLKVIDLTDDANQPMTVMGKCYIVYNGEIYNYIELRQELEDMGYLFRTSSDTEVLIYAYLAWGKECLHHLNGMFAFVIYDPHRRVVFAARDRFGIKPIYWWRSPTGAILVASEIKQFTCHPAWHAVGNTETLKDFLYSGMVDHSRETMFDGVYQLRGGESVEIPLDDPDVEKHTYRWYDLHQTVEERLKSRARVNIGAGGSMGDEVPYEKAVAIVRALLEDAVRIRMRSDVPVGSCLSGGIDSSSIVCLAAPKVSDGQFNTFTMTSEDGKYNETRYAEIVADTVGADRHYISPNVRELFDRLDELVWQQDEPFQSTSMYGQWAVFRCAAQAQVPVILDGQGADEMLLGYHYVFPIYLKNLVQQGKVIQFLREMYFLRKIPGFKYRSIVQLAYNFYKKRKNTSTSTQRGVPMDFSTLKTYSHTLLFYTSLPALLHWEDRDSMSHTVESRLPFLDYRLVEYVYGLPDSYKLHDAITKRVLRDAMQGILPDVVRNRMDKIGFSTSEEIWFERNTDEFRKRFYEAVELSNGLLGEKDIEKFEKVARKEMGYDFSIWRAIAFGAWVKKFNVEVKSNDS